MTPMKHLAERYVAAASVATRAASIELVAIADPVGARLDASVCEVWHLVREDDLTYGNELLAASRQLRWRRATEPYPARYSRGRVELAAAVTRLAGQRMHVSGRDTREMLRELADRASDAASAEHPVAGTLLESISEAEPRNCVVIFVSPRAAQGARHWFRGLGVEVAAAGGGEAGELRVREQAYLVGAPELFGTAVFSAPRAYRLGYLFPSWVPDPTLPEAAFSRAARGGIRPRPRVYRLGAEHGLVPPTRAADDHLVPAPAWARPDIQRSPAGEEEVVARRVLLAGGKAMWLDQGGGRIRSLDPSQPPGERVLMRDEETVAPGTILVLREGETESEALYTRSLALLGSQAEAATSSQEEWKRALSSKLKILGRARVIDQLAGRGVQASRRAPY